MQTKASTAILIFSRTAFEEAAIKTFHSNLNEKGNIVIAKKLIKETVSTSKTTGLPVFKIFSSKQKGQNFGEKLANAIESVFKKGFKNVIAIGNDCPTLTTKCLFDAAQNLENRDLVLGPSEDGGVYLIGINQQAYDRSEFIALPWEKVTLQSGFENYSKNRASEIIWLESKCDIDDAFDFKKLLNVLSKFSRLRRHLENIITSFQRVTFIEFSAFFKTLSFRNLSLRAPPKLSL